jgi:penicillin-binding protein 2
MVGMVEQAGTGARAAGPMLKRIWDGVFGVGQKSVLPGGKAPTRLPHIAPQTRVASR